MRLLGHARPRGVSRPPHTLGGGGGRDRTQDGLSLTVSLCAKSTPDPTLFFPGPQDVLAIPPDACVQNGADDVKKHKWFASISFPDLEKRAITPPIKPEVGKEDDTGNFE